MTSASPSPPPPSLPTDSIYTACYCEENVYLLARQFFQDSAVSAHWDVFVVFISNPSKSVALWNQKLRDGVVLWDYHVILVLRHRSPDQRDRDMNGEESDRRAAAKWVYDYDSRLPLPVRWEDYISQTFPSSVDVPEEYRSCFRVVPAEEYLETFASDRSHMVAPTIAIGEASSEMPRYISPPPTYEVLCGSRSKLKGITNNLMASFVSMEEGELSIGVVYLSGTISQWK